ncbi:MAG: hypothetical protein H6582_01090 [Crocinitomicaceae bacterium]|nr:hypothetical protein [Crocinitomicaceae bacterium]
MDYKFHKDTVYTTDGNGFSVTYRDTTRHDEYGKPLIVGRDSYFGIDSVSSIHRYGKAYNFPTLIEFYETGEIKMMNFGDDRSGVKLEYREDGTLEYSSFIAFSFFVYTTEYDSLGNVFAIYDYGSDGKQLEENKLQANIDITKENLAKYYYFTYLDIQLLFEFLEDKPLFVNSFFLPKKWIDSTDINLLVELLESEEKCYDIYASYKDDQNKKEKVSKSIVAEKLIKHYLYGFLEIDYSRERILKDLGESE